LSPGSSQQQARHRFEPPGNALPEGKFVCYFFLTGFLVAFFFAMVLFSFGLDLAAFVPGFFFIGIEYPPLRSLLLDKRKTFLVPCLSTIRIIETRYALRKHFTNFL
jgi:hypothetical protein